MIDANCVWLNKNELILSRKTWRLFWIRHPYKDIIHFFYWVSQEWKLAFDFRRKFNFTLSYVQRLNIFKLLILHWGSSYASFTDNLLKIAVIALMTPPPKQRKKKTLTIMGGKPSHNFWIRLLNFGPLSLITVPLTKTTRWKWEQSLQ